MNLLAGGYFFAKNRFHHHHSGEVDFKIGEKKISERPWSNQALFKGRIK
jgi:hypothetical protein